MFGIGGSEIFFIIIIALMLFGSKNIPDIARTLGKGFAQLRHATNEIKNEITKSAEENGLGDLKEMNPLNDLKDINPINDIKESLNPLNDIDLTSDVQKEIDQAKEDIEQMTGPIKRQR
ncbi:twin-arginine translocase TatA/TatE family subunit [Flavobacterium agricola]|uniref:Twin-arginine translocase TatA/TatE family subunit n=1 Tax=Flavobacterium agricola TaxID=2870839 RepID=A0ABY6M0F9_9FLAO|nr:twin-arginine translocase TatA/TatE family subunit [Flavobacterium agricola]UYW00673.1 twin-arginine translocase TatA/TatE family subunit [Flavobacterium agricola]